jgi:hypothetical protein
MAGDEAQRFEQFGRQFAAMQSQMSAPGEQGRALHRRGLLALKGTLEVLADLPEPARHGLFAQPGHFDAWVRLSNGGPGRQPDHRPDVRGFAIKAWGVQGPGAMGQAQVDSQDFLLIQRSVSGFARSAEFAAVALASAKGPLAVLAALVRHHGLLGGLRRLKGLVAGLNTPFSGFATERFHSALPLACGPYAARVRLLPPAGETAQAGAQNDWAADVTGRLAQQALVCALQLQFFVSEALTPIEDGSVDWPESVAPYVTVARLTLPRQAADPAFAEQVEAARFDPWGGLAAHRPLGELMRARKAVYYASQQGRNAG